MKRLTFLFPALALMFLFSGCGQSGPLYIQGNPSTMAAPPAQPTTSDDESEEEQDDSESSDVD
jgi:predicted small lipoprotein YifL